MKYTQFKTVALMLSAAVLLGLSGCNGTAGTESNSGIGEVPVVVPPLDGNVTPPPVYDTNTSALIGDGSTSDSSTTRNVAIDSSGNIYVAYHGTNGIFVSVSKDSGSTFATPIQLSTLDREVSVAVSSNGTVFVAWTEESSVLLSRSLDGGATYSTVANLSNLGFGTSIHMDTDGSNIYLVERNGTQVLYSNDNGENFTITSVPGEGVFSDIRVDKASHYVYLQTDNPTIYYYVSTDFGETFSSAVQPGGAIFYSTTAISSGINGRYLFVSGSATEAFRVDLDTNTSTPLVFGQNTSSQGRSLAADSLGNVVDGFFNDTNGTSVYFAVSHNSGDTFSDAIKVDENSTNISVEIDSVNNKIVVAYEKDAQVYVKTYVDMLLQ